LLVVAVVALPMLHQDMVVVVEQVDYCINNLIKLPPVTTILF
jgi:hypothetical protein